MNYKLRTKTGFTLIELMVAIAVLVIVLSFAGVIFKVSIGAYRTSMANAEIMQKLRAITDQLNADFKGLRKDAPMAIWFEGSNGLRYDGIAFLSNGDFQSVRQYRYMKSDGEVALKTVFGNVASIYYYYNQASDPNLLVRKQKILTSDDSLIDSPFLYDPNEFQKDSLAEWKVRPADQYFLDWIWRHNKNPLSEEYIPMYLIDGVRSFAVQMQLTLWDWDEDDIRFEWFPRDEGFPDEAWGLGFNIPEDSDFDDWFFLGPEVSLKALKFTFTLYDSRGVIERGRTFTHIVYLGE